MSPIPVKVFKEKIPEEIFSDDGWQIREVVTKKTIHPEGGQPFTINQYRYELVNDQNVVVEEADLCREFEDNSYDRLGFQIEIYFYEERTGRARDIAFKMDPHLFPQGTIFEVRKFSGQKDFNDPSAKEVVRFTADRLYKSGARHWIVVTQELIPDVIDKEKMVPIRYSLGHVVKIIKRGQGPLILDERLDDWPEVDGTKPLSVIERLRIAQDEILQSYAREGVTGLQDVKLKKGEFFCRSPESFISMLFLNEAQKRNYRYRGYFDISCLNLIRHSACLRIAQVYRDEVPIDGLGKFSRSIRYRYGAAIINVRRIKARLKNKAHMFFESFDNLVKEEKREDEQYARELENF